MESKCLIFCDKRVFHIVHGSSLRTGQNWEAKANSDQPSKWWMRASRAAKLLFQNEFINALNQQHFCIYSRYVSNGCRR